jgi:inosine-uridine nucleoside N-ribohydrolase
MIDALCLPDVGIDDVTAILMALADETVKVEAITVVSGNVSRDQGLETIRYDYLLLFLYSRLFMIGVVI